MAIALSTIFAGILGKSAEIKTGRFALFKSEYINRTWDVSVKFVNIFITVKTAAPSKLIMKEIKKIRKTMSIKPIFLWRRI